MVRVMYTASNDDRGTVQALARELEEVHQDGTLHLLTIRPCSSPAHHCSDDVLYQLSPRHEVSELNSKMYHALLRHVNMIYPTLDIRSFMDAPSATSMPLVATAVVFDSVVIRGSRFRASRRSQNAHGSLVEVALDGTGRTGVGELTDILLVEQPHCGTLTLGVIKWLSPLQIDIHETVWQKL